MKWSVEELNQAIDGKILSKVSSGFNFVSIDTRSMKEKDYCFFALKGKKDGHDFLKDACQKKATVLVVSSLSDTSLQKEATIIQVKDVQKALEDFSSYWKKKINFQVVGITGSVGKTAAKHFCQILFQADSSVLVSPKNYNNHLGVPLSMLRAEDHHKVLIQEIGTSHKGEIKKLCQLSKPSVAACTLVGWSHAEGLGGIKEIAVEKESIYQEVSTGIFNLDNSWTREMSFRFKGKKLLTFSQTESSADIFLKTSKMGMDFLEVEGKILDQKGSCRISLSGEHYLCSIMTSIGVALSLGYSPQDIWKKLPLLRSYKDRSQWVDWNSKKIFFDAYNANPCSMDAFLEYMKFLSKEHSSITLFLGDMLELGSRASSFHKELGKKAGSLPISSIFYFGGYFEDFEQGLKEVSFSGNYESFKKYDSKRVSNILSLLKDGDILGIKASRDVGLDQVMHGIVNS